MTYDFWLYIWHLNTVNYSIPFNAKDQAILIFNIINEKVNFVLGKLGLIIHIKKKLCLVGFLLLGNSIIFH